MIRVKKIEIHEFRGIRNLIIDFKNQNFAICGRNGTGKSGIVDALEFALTSNISRLSGSGTGGISVKDHAPHVDSRNDPDKARIVLTVSIPSINKDVVIERSVKNHDNPKITPDNSDVQRILSEVAAHPEFVLSRRELIKYVISTPGDRAKEVQALLKLDKVENLRTVFQKIANSNKKEVSPLKWEKDDARKQLLISLNITELNQTKLLEAVNIRREALGLGAIAVLTPTTSLKDGLVAAVGGSKVIRIPKDQALADIKELRDLLSSITSTETVEKLLAIKEKLNTLNSSPVALAGVTREKFLRLAIQLVDAESCPVCDTAWNTVELKKFIENKLKAFDAVTTKRTEIEKELEPFIEDLRVLYISLANIEEYGALLKPAISTEEVKKFRILIQKKKELIESFLPLQETISAVDTYAIIPESIIDTMTVIEKAITSIPEPTEQDAARDYLTISQERLEKYRAMSLRHKQSEERADLTTKIFNTYAKVTTEFLNGIYKEVEKNFTELYRFINQDDEGGFTAQLTPSIGKLGFDVDFYGRGYFPPGAYHSEGHQDGMGLCLYLALMKHLLGESFTFAVLDDVLMSVDSGHRREVCSLLKERFPDTQFILTTHDDVWLKHMKTAGLIPATASIQFRKWDVNHGPHEWSYMDIWDEINENIKNNNIVEAAALLRHYLEFVSSEICHRLRARVEFRGDAQFQLGDLLAPATSQFSKLLGEGEKAATSWQKTVEADMLKKRKLEFDALVVQSKLEQWQTNSAIHYNQWANLEAKDFAPVVEIFRKLVESFFCIEENCQSLFRVVPERGQRESVKCSCGTININLQKRSQ
jgi:recombinational DNA repair ATPase RecF